MPVVEVDRAALDIRPLDVRRRLQDVPVGDEEGRVFADFDGTDAVGDTEDLRGRQGDRTECFFRCESEGRGRGGMVGQVAGVGRRRIVPAPEMQNLTPAFRSRSGNV